MATKVKETTLLAGEKLYPVGEAMRVAGIVGQGDQGRAARHPSTLARWVIKGVSTPSGTVRLEAVRLSAEWWTSAEAFVRFVTAQTASRMNPTEETPTMPRTKSQRAKALAAAEQRLDELGV